MIDTAELIPLAHTPIKPARPCTPGEGIYLSLWQAYIEGDPSRLDRILWSHRWETSQRDASICASFMVFMGCAGGRSLHLHAEELKRKGIRPREAYLFAWAQINERCKATNSGLRVVEYMLASEHPIGNERPFSGRVVEDRVPELTMRDLDVIECMAEWWSDTDAAQMREIAEAQIEIENRKRMTNLFNSVEVA